MIVGDKLDGTADVGPRAVYMAAWVPPFAAGGTEPTAGLSENCGGHLWHRRPQVAQHGVYVSRSRTAERSGYRDSTPA